ncbi:MAG: hypothetical protein EXX96DRAFT_589914 [Benjaminiella poitrasii]|nr:MAG: hypothetical protein EXX96DRAFT_589914 [Benjaminiella poitrasii]
MVAKGSNTRKRISPHLEYPCVVCDFNCDNPSQILNHYQKIHSFDFETHAAVVPDTLPPQFGCPLCHFCCDRIFDLLISHYEEDHKLFLIVEGDDIKELPDNERQQKQEEKQVSASSSTEAATKEDTEKYLESTTHPTEPKESHPQSPEDAKRTQMKEGKESKQEEAEHHLKSREILQKLNEITDMLVNVFRSPSQTPTHKDRKH